MLINVILGGETKRDEHGNPFVVGGQPAIMESDELERRDFVKDDEIEHTEITEFWHEGGLVHRSVDMRLKKALFANGFQASF